MTIKLEIDPFEFLRKNAHIWEGHKATLWYHEKLDSSFTLLVIYDFEDTKRQLVLEVNNRNKKIEFKNSEMSEELYQHALMEMEVFKGISKLK